MLFATVWTFLKMALKTDWFLVWNAESSGYSFRKLTQLNCQVAHGVVLKWPVFGNSHLLVCIQLHLMYVSGVSVISPLERSVSCVKHNYNNFKTAVPHCTSSKQFYHLTKGCPCA